MLHAHLDSLTSLAEPLDPSRNTVAGSLFDFAGSDIPQRVRAHVPLMLRERLTPPPTESYSIHRKLMGVWMLCVRLRARVPAARIFQEGLAME